MMFIAIVTYIKIFSPLDPPLDTADTRTTTDTDIADTRSRVPYIAIVQPVQLHCMI